MKQHPPPQQHPPPSLAQNLPPQLQHQPTSPSSPSLPSVSQPLRESEPELDPSEPTRKSWTPNDEPDAEDCEASAGVYDCFASGCFFQCAAQMLSVFSRFCICCMASNTFGKMVQPFGFPGITVYLFFGLLCGPFVFDLMSREDQNLLKWINDVALGFIGLSAGGHFHLNDVLGNLKPVMTVLFFLVVMTFTGTMIVIMVLGDYFIPFFVPLEQSQKLAAASLIACLAVARSPSSAIAIITELNAKGPFTTVFLAVTVMMDVVVVVLFSFVQLFATALDVGSSSNPATHARRDDPAMLLGMFLVQVSVSVMLGFILGHTLPLFVGWVPRELTLQKGSGLGVILFSAVAIVARILLLLVQRATLIFSGWSLFFEEQLSDKFGDAQWQNPLIVCMVAGFVMVNFTQGGLGFNEIVNDVSAPMFLFFFTFTGVCMDVGVLARNLPACLLIFSTRLVCIVVSSYVGGRLSKSPEDHSTKYWMAFITQAGVTLGLAQSAGAHFAWGPDFSASIVAVVVLNQVLGPPLLKRAITLVGEKYHNYVPKNIEQLTEPQLGKAHVPVTAKPQPRGALVIASDGWEADMVIAQLGRLQWEVLHADETLAVYPSDNAAKRALERRSTYHIGALPRPMREEITSFNLAPRPWERIAAHRSLPSMKTQHYQQGRRNTAGSVEEARGLRRANSFDPRRPKSALDLLRAPPAPPMPEDKLRNPERYSQCMRLLWLAASMKSFDVVVVLLPDDAQSLVMCQLIADMLPLLQFTRKSGQKVQLVVALHDESLVETLVLKPEPFVIPRHEALPALVCEVLHPNAHWTGQLYGGAPASLPGESSSPSRSRTPRHSHSIGSPSGDSGFSPRPRAVQSMSPQPRLPSPPPMALPKTSKTPHSGHSKSSDLLKSPKLTPGTPPAPPAALAAGASGAGGRKSLLGSGASGAITFLAQEESEAWRVRHRKQPAAKDDAK